MQIWELGVSKIEFYFYPHYIFCVSNMRFLRNWKKVLRLLQCRIFWLTTSECVFKNLHIASVIHYMRIYSIALYFSCLDFCEKMFSLCLVIYRQLPTFCFVLFCL